MPESIITSKDNPRVKAVVRLNNSARARREAGLFVAEGLRLVQDAALNGYRFPEVFYTEDMKEKHPEELESVLEAARNAYLVSTDVMIKLSDTVTPQGIVALCEIPNHGELHCDDGLYIALENTQNPANLGAIARSAEAFGAKGIVISSTSCDPFAPKSLRAGMGALLRLPIYIVPDFSAALLQMQVEGARLYASVVSDNALDILLAPKAKSRVLLIGNEANGLTSEIADVCDYRVTIPMTGRAESLNAATAATVLIWEMQKGGR